MLVFIDNDSEMEIGEGAFKAATEVKSLKKSSYSRPTQSRLID